MTDTPLTANGKIDRQRLPMVSDADRYQQSYVAPRNDLERTLCEVWGALLQVEQVGIEDNFFDLGGDSLLAIQMKGALNEQGWQFELPRLFEGPSIVELAPALVPYEATSEVTAFSLLKDSERALLPAGLADAYPASRLQLGMLYHGGLNEGEDVYHELISYRLQMPFDGALLQQAVNRLVEQHDILRTRFDLASFSEPLQLVESSVSLPIGEEDLRHLTLAAQNDYLTEWAVRERQRRLVIEQAPLMRVYVHRLSDEMFQLTYSTHHSLWDGWSESILTTELLRGYANLLQGEAYPLRELACRYRDFIALEQAALASDATRAYWQQTLAGAEVVSLPQEGQGAVGEMVDAVLQLSAPETEALEALARRLAVPLKSVLLAAHLKMLSVYSGRGDVVTGLVCNGRPEQVGGAESVGLFLNTVPLRYALGVEDWESLIQGVAASEQQMLPHRRYPLPDIMALTGGQTWFETLFNYTNFRVYNDYADNNDTIVSRHGEIHTNIPLSVNFWHDAGELKGAITGLEMFSREHVEGMATLFKSILLAMLKDSKQLNWLLQTPSDQMNSVVPTPKTTRVSFDLFTEIAKQISLYSEKTAVIYGSNPITYADLNTAIKHVEQSLQDQGVTVGDTVAISMERNLNWLTTLLGVIKIGACYLPVDPNLPLERREFMLNQASAMMVVSESGSESEKKSIDELPLGRTLIFTQLTEDLKKPTNKPQITRERLAYKIFTSGTTGLPKPVGISYHSLSCYIDAITRQLEVSPSDRILQLTHMGFDPSIEQIFSALSIGATLCLPTQELMSGTELVDWARNIKASFINVTPSYFQEILSAEEAFTSWCNDSLKAVILGGEAIQRQMIQSFFRMNQSKQCRFYNAYGPTEATIGSVISEITDANSEIIPIGTAIGERQLLILDEQLNPVPRGVIGELYIVGEELAVGYMGQAKLTAEKFLPAAVLDKTNSGDLTKEISLPNSPTIGSRMYRTGDMVLQQANGNLVYKGRRDNQLKVNGYRIELAEIEHAIAQINDIKNFTVVAMGESLKKDIAVFYVGEVTPSKIVEVLRSSLPHYVIPKAFQRLDALPVLPSGKIDLKALSNQTVQRVNDDPLVAPETPTEETLCQIWQQVLEQPSISVSTDFFALGGASLSAMRIASKISQQFDILLPIRCVFEQPTIRRVARVVDELIQKGGSQVKPITRYETQIDYPLSDNQESLWWANQLVPGNPALHMVAAVRMVGELDIEKLTTAVLMLVENHRVLRTRFREHNNSLLQTISERAEVDSIVLKVSNETSQQQQLQLAIEKPFDLANGPLVRFCCISQGKQHSVALVIHHIVTDGWSGNLLIQELLDNYNNLPAPESSSQVDFFDYLLWSKEPEIVEARQTTAEELATLAQGCRRLELPIDNRIQPTADKITGALNCFEIPNELSRSISHSAQTLKSTEYLLMLSAYSLVLSRLASGQQEFFVGSPVANRVFSELQEMPGFFANLLPIGVKLQPTMKVIDLLSQLKEFTTPLLSTQDLSIQEPLTDAASKVKNELISTTFSLADTAKASLSSDRTASELVIDGVTVTEESVSQKYNQFDLMLECRKDVSGTLKADLWCSDRLSSNIIVQEIIDEFLQALTFLTQNTDSCISEFMMPKAHLLSSPNLLSVNDWFAHQVKSTPDKVAVIDGTDTLTYHQLDHLSSVIAAGLSCYGACQGDRVAIRMERSASAVATMLAVSKLGATYVPIDTQSPILRVQEVLKHAKTELLVGDDSNLQVETSVVNSVSIEELKRAANSQPLAKKIEVSSNAPLYIIFTSGSTGVPKGVIANHQGVVRLVKQTDYIDFDKVQCIAQASSLAFDAAVFEIYGTLLNGKTLSIVTKDVLLTPASFKEQQQADGIDTLFLTTALFNLYSTELPAALSPMTYLLFGGEQVDTNAVSRQLESGKPKHLLHVYGPTENTTFSSYYEITEDPGSAETIPIGKSIHQSELHVLDDFLRPVPTGVIGELYTSGAGLATGYWSAPSKTAGSFVPSPFNENRRLYRTGDWVKKLKSKDIEFVGRVDGQIKIRGFRIELGDIERRLLNKEQVLSVTVTTSGTGDNKEIIAYCVHSNPSTQTRKELRSYLKQHLPAYMLPAAIVWIDSIPININGKVDRASLPKPKASDRCDDDFRSPASILELEFASMVSELLNIDSVNMLSNFFEMGGNSLLAVQLCNRLNHKYQSYLTISEMFSCVTLLDLHHCLLKHRLEISNDENLEKIVESLSDEEVASIELLMSE
ncbi:non-ribosomal peptide synthetase [Pleionea sediminis]|uniref:non-ribosomal peptide synthetase n=1 Tax=Pleionea sediminis TaxID=2569479 RepID=UPI00197C1EE5|nr:non-ribosomal peptide synthetase [Pleionea sediminis]